MLDSWNSTDPEQQWGSQTDDPFAAPAAPQTPAAPSAPQSPTPSAAPAPAPSATPQPSGQAAQVVESLGVAPVDAPAAWGDPINTGSGRVEPGGFTGGGSTPDYQSLTTAVQNATDPASQATARDRLARSVASALQAAGHQVEWNGEQLIVDGRGYDVTGAAPGGWDQTKWNDPNHLDPKYLAGHIMAAGGSNEDVAKALGGRMIDADTLEYRNPQTGQVEHIDLRIDVEGANTPWWNLEGGGAAGGGAPGGAGYAAGGLSGGAWGNYQLTGANAAAPYTPGSFQMDDPGYAALVQRLSEHPESLDAHTVAMMEARDAEEKGQAALSADEAAQRFGNSMGYIDSPWLASERTRTAADYDRQIIEGRRNTEIEAARTNTADLRASIGTLTSVWSQKQDAFALNEQLKIEAAKLGLSQQQFVQQLQVRLMELEQNDRQFNASQGQNDRQFGARLGFDYDSLNERSNENYWGGS